MPQYEIGERCGLKMKKGSKYVYVPKKDYGRVPAAMLQQKSECINGRCSKKNKEAKPRKKRKVVVEESSEDAVQSEDVQE